MKLLKDFGVRALLAVVALVCFELILAATLAVLAKLGLLDVQTALALCGAGQAPMMLAMGFYFGTKAGPPTP